MQHAFTCECEATERKTYRVVSHEGQTALVSYCIECYELAKVDWNGETASIEEVCAERGVR